MRPSSPESEEAKNDPGPRGFRFPREARLRKKKEFDLLFQRGAKAVTPALVVFVLKNGMSRNRLGLSVSRRHGDAVRRNRIRRLLRESFRLQNRELPQGFDLVCIPRTGGVFPDSSREALPLFRTAFLKGVARLKDRDQRGEG